MRAARRTQAEAGLVGEAIAAGRAIPDLPEDCRRREASGVQEGDRLDVALLKTDRALGSANDRVARCAAWHDDIRRHDGAQERGLDAGRNEQ